MVLKLKFMAKIWDRLTHFLNRSINQVVSKYHIIFVDIINNKINNSPTKTFNFRDAQIKPSNMFLTQISQKTVLYQETFPLFVFC